MVFRLLFFSSAQFFSPLNTWKNIIDISIHRIVDLLKHLRRHLDFIRQVALVMRLESLLSLLRYTRNIRNISWILSIMLYEVLVALSWSRSPEACANIALLRVSLSHLSSCWKLSLWVFPWIYLCLDVIRLVSSRVLTHIITLMRNLMSHISPLKLVLSYRISAVLHINNLLKMNRSVLASLWAYMSLIRPVVSLHSCSSSNFIIARIFIERVLRRRDCRLLVRLSMGVLGLVVAWLWLRLFWRKFLVSIVYKASRYLVYQG